MRRKVCSELEVYNLNLKYLIFNCPVIHLYNRFWCETCDTFAYPLCHRENHMMTDILAKEAEEHDTLVVQVESGAQDALNKRNEGEEPLVIEQNQLKVKLDAVMTKIRVNRFHKEKLMAVIANCQKMKQISSASKSMAFIRKNLEKNLKEMKEEIKRANDFLKRTTTQAVNRRDKVHLIVSLLQVKHVLD